MKKTLIICLLLMLAACSAKAVPWEDVKAEYDELYTQAIETAESQETCSVDQFKQLVEDIKLAANEVEAGVDEKKAEELKALFSKDMLLQQLVQRSNSIHANILNSLTVAVEELIKAAYEKGDVAGKKGQIGELLKQIDSFTDDDWKTVEVHKRLAWTDVEEEYREMSTTLIEGLKKLSEVDELELEELKDTIINNASHIRDGISAENKANADVIYEAATILYAYTSILSSDTGLKVSGFAANALAYVKDCYEGKGSSSSFLEEVEAAEKWTLSMLNELATEMRKN